MKTEVQEKKPNPLVKAVSDVFRRLSITVNLTVYSIYLIYLIYSIFADVGVKFINIALALITVAFMVVYLVLRLSDKRRGKELKQIKLYYKRFKLVARAVTSITAVYALIVAMNSDPFALIVALLGAVFVVLRLIVELISYLVGRSLKKFKKNISDSISRKKEADELAKYDLPTEEKTKKRPRKRRKNDGAWPEAFENLEDKIVDIDDCLLSDIESD